MVFQDAIFLKREVTKAQNANLGENITLLSKKVFFWDKKCKISQQYCSTPPLQLIWSNLTSIALTNLHI
jgi:hypothetical protein